MKLLICLLRGHRPYRHDDLGPLLQANGGDGRVLYVADPCSRCGLIQARFTPS